MASHHNDPHQAYTDFCKALDDYDPDKLASYNDCPKNEFSVACSCGFPERTSLSMEVKKDARL